MLPSVFPVPHVLKEGPTKAKGPASKPADTQPPSRPVPADAALKRVLPSVEFADKPLDDAFAELAKMLHTSILVRWPALESAGVDAKKRVDLKTSNVTAETVIKLLLSGAGGTARLGHELRDGMLVVSTREDLDMRTTVTRSYDVSRLLHVETVVSTIKRNVAPGDWAPEGTVASITVGPHNHLRVTAPERIHCHVAPAPGERDFQMYRDLSGKRARSRAAPLGPHGIRTAERSARPIARRRGRAAQTDHPLGCGKTGRGRKGGQKGGKSRKNPPGTPRKGAKSVSLRDKTFLESRQMGVLRRARLPRLPRLPGLTGGATL